MSILEFVASLLGSFAWPITVIAVAFLFRKPLSTLLYGLTTFRYGGLEMDFGRELAEVESAAKDAQLQLDAPVQEPLWKGQGRVTQTRPLLERIEALAENHPDAAVALAWGEVEAELMSTVMRLAVSPDYPPHNSAIQNIRYLHDAGWLNEETYNLAHRLRTTADLVIRGRYRHGQISPNEALEYGTIAQAFVERLRNLSNHR